MGHAVRLHCRQQPIRMDGVCYRYLWADSLHPAFSLPRIVRFPILPGLPSDRLFIKSNEEKHSGLWLEASISMSGLMP